MNSNKRLDLDVDIKNKTSATIAIKNNLSGSKSGTFVNLSIESDDSLEN